MNSNTHFNLKVIRILFIIIIFSCVNSRVSPAQIISGYEYIKIIKLINNERIDIVSQIAIGNKYVLTKDVKAYDLDNISYKYEMLFECNTSEKSGTVNPYISFMRRDNSYCEDLYMAFYFEHNCDVIHQQYLILKDFMNTNFNLNLANDNADNKCNNLVQKKEIPFPKFETSDVEIGSCSIWQSTLPGNNLSSLIFSLHIFKKKL